MKTKTHQDLCWHLPLLVAVFIQLWPIVFMVSTSLKDMDQIFQATLNPLPLPPTLNNYLTVLGNFPLFTYIYNTFFIAAFVTVFKVLTSVLAAFAFIYYDFKYKETVSIEEEIKKLTAMLNTNPPPFIKKIIEKKAA